MMSAAGLGDGCGSRSRALRLKSTPFGGFAGVGGEQLQLVGRLTEYFGTFGVEPPELRVSLSASCGTPGSRSDPAER